MKQNSLGTTPLKVTEIGFGCWALDGGPNWGPQEDRDSIDSIQTALDCGITFFDTAEAYSQGKSEQVLAKGLGTRRDEAFIATKVSPSHFEPSLLREACERSLGNLETDRIDFYQLHWPASRYPIEDAVATLNDLRAEGKIRGYGVSNFGPGQLAGYLAAGGQTSTNQIAYSLLFRATEIDLIPASTRAGIGIIAYSPLLQGLLTGKMRTIADVPVERQRIRHYSPAHENARHGESGHEALTFQTIDRIRRICHDINRPMGEVAIRWLLDHGQVTSVLVGARNGDQVRRNAAAAADPLSPDTLQALDTATGELKQAMGPNPDLWQGESRIR